MMNLIRIIACTLVIFLTCQSGNQLSAAHIVGGDMTYRYISHNADSTKVTFEINVTLYRDNLSMGAGFDNSNETAFGVWRRNLAGEWVLYNDVRNIGPGIVTEIIPPDDPCVEEPVNEVGVEESSYIFQVTLDVGDRDYMVAYQRCCRNQTIANIFEPGDAGAAFDVIITPQTQREGNDSPIFVNYPPIFICAGYPIEIDQSVIDTENDEIKYSFCAPVSAGGTRDSQGANSGMEGCCDCVRPSPARCGPSTFSDVVFLPPYGPSTPLAGNPVVVIDEATGIITGVPQITGQFVVAVCVEEIRDNMSLGKIRRDFQFNVLECDRAVTAILESDESIPDPNSSGGVDVGNSNIFIINACGETTINMKNKSTDQRYIRSYDWEFYDGVGNVIFQENGAASSRDVDVSFPGEGEYTGRMIVNEGLACSDTAPFTINLYPAISADYQFEYDTCNASPVKFLDESVTGAPNLVGWAWDFDGEGAADIPEPDFQFSKPGLKDVSLVVTDDNECTDVLTKEVAYYPAPSTIIVEPNVFIGCAPSEITLENLSAPIDSTYDITWDLGDGNVSKEISPKHIYQEPGNYSLSLEIISPIGCQIARGFDSWITIKDSPEAAFDCSPDDPNIYEKTVKFSDLSSGAGSWLWNFGTIGSSFDQNPTFTFPDTGVYKVLLTTYHPVTNCPDTISKFIDVAPLVEFHFPNAFTPNNDASNDEFLGNGYYGGLADFNLSIFNRWGQLVFETDNPRDGWNGSLNNSGAASPQGVYVFKASYKGPRGERIVEDGHVTLLR